MDVVDDIWISATAKNLALAWRYVSSSNVCCSRVLVHQTQQRNFIFGLLTGFASGLGGATP